MERKTHTEGLVTSIKWPAYWLLVAITFGIYLSMVIWTLPEISAAADGEPAFDLRLMGYDFDEATVFLNKLNHDGHDVYLGIQHTLDTFFPGLLGIILTIGLVRMAPNTNLGVAFSLFAVAGGIFDYLENYYVRVMLLTDVNEVTPEMVGTASNWTLLKSACSLIAYSALTAFLIFWACHRYFNENKV